ncbi:phosphoribosylamine--glycine ligase, partial [Candidatus Micrarchaeota archaeon]|nr:phosphoribosylamine--glycine ligase [Candidatus Micrarchaeota archaeon]
GSYTCENHSLPFVTTEEYGTALEVVDKTVKGIEAKTGKPYRGILYAQFMVTASGPKIIEFNARFGDPEAMNVLPLLKSDLHDICTAIVNQTLEELEIVFEKKASVCKYIVPAGYPDRKDKFKFSIDESVLGETQLFYSGVEQKEDGLYTTGSRGFGLTSLGSTLQDAYDEVETAISRIDMTGFRYRKDIASADSIRKKMERMERLRG